MKGCEVTRRTSRLKVCQNRRSFPHLPVEAGFLGDSPKREISIVGRDFRLKSFAGLCHFTGPVPAFHYMLQADGDDDAKNDGPKLLSEIAPRVNGLDLVNIHRRRLL